LPIRDVLLAGKTGTAQVVGLHISDGKTGPWKFRDHGHFIAYAPFDKPRYACAVVVEHGGGSAAAYPIARDVMTFLYDPAKAMDVLRQMEAGWGGTPIERLNTKYRAYEARYGTSAPKPTEDNPVAAADARAAEAGARPQPVQTDANPPRAEEASAPAPAASPAASPSPNPTGSGATP
jgi:penicillin-binding protein 2